MSERATRVRTTLHMRGVALLTLCWLGAAERVRLGSKRESVLHTPVPAAALLQLGARQELSSAVALDTAEMLKPNNTKLLIAYLSGGSQKYAQRRNMVRERCFPAIRAAGLDVRFFVGRPSHIEPGSHVQQGASATGAEIEDAHALAAEQELHRDMVVVPFRDMYRDLSDKVTQLFQRTVVAGYEVVMKIDDDHCPGDLEGIRRYVEALKPEELSYVGQYMFRGDEYPNMAGADGTVSKYMSGVCYLVSKELAKTIFFEDETHTVLFAPYGTDSDDANLGKWYDYAKEAHPDLTFREETLKDLCREIQGA